MLNRVAAISAIGIAAVAGTLHTAQAQSPSPLAEWQYTAGIPLEKMFEKQTPTWRVNLGIGTSMRSIYPGDDRDRVRVGPSISIRYRDRYFASTGEGIGVDVIDTRHLQLGVSLGYSLGRQQSSDEFHLRGLGNIPVAPVVMAFANYVVSKRVPLVIQVVARRGLGGARGWTGTFSAYMPLPGSSRRFRWFAGPTVTIADAGYMQQWFGVSAAQAAHSQYGVYRPHAGLRSYGGGVTAVWFFRKHWLLDANAAIEELVNGAGHSPITQSPANLTVDATVAYRF